MFKNTVKIDPNYENLLCFCFFSKKSLQNFQFKVCIYKYCIYKYCIFKYAFSSIAFSSMHLHINNTSRVGRYAESLFPSHHSQGTWWRNYQAGYELKLCLPRKSPLNYLWKRVWKNVSHECSFPLKNKSIIKLQQGHRRSHSDATNNNHTLERIPTP